MAESAWRFFRNAKRRIADGTINFDGGTFKLHLYRSGSNISAPGTVSTKGALTNELTGHANYTQSGITLAGVTYTISGSVTKWDADDISITASAANWSQIRFAMIQHSDVPIVWCELSTAQIEVTTGNSLTIQFAASGIFELSGGET